MKSKNNNFFIYSKLTPIWGKKGTFFNNNHYNGKISVNNCSVESLLSTYNNLISFSQGSLTSITRNNMTMINSKGCLPLLFSGTSYIKDVLIIFNSNFDRAVFSGCKSQGFENNIQNSGLGTTLDKLYMDMTLDHSFNFNYTGDTFYDQLNSLMNENKYIYID